MSKPRIAAVILAAGASSRFGQPKQLLEWDNRPLILSTVDTAWAAGLNPIIVVLGAYADEIEPVLLDRPVQLQRNYHWSEGISSSIRTGITALPGSVDGALFIPGDQPLLTVAFLKELIECFGRDDKEIVVPTTTDGSRGSPVLFARRFFPELSQLLGDAGGRLLLNRYPDDIFSLLVKDSRLLMDIDTPEAYAKFREFTAEGQELDMTPVHAIICDMDGVLWRGQEPLAGFSDFFRFVRKHKLDYILVTNNSSRTPAQYAEKIEEMGVTVSEEHILNSAVSAANYVAEISPGASVYPIGGPGVLDALAQYGLMICQDDINQVDFVVVGWDQKLTWQKLATATRLILDGARFIGTNPDLTFPLESSLAPGNGAQLAALQAATGMAPFVTGKPERLLYQQAMDRMKSTPVTTLVIGDRLDTDILGGVRLGMPTAMVLTGVCGIDAVRNSPIRPGIIFDNLPKLLANWDKQLERRIET
jgi:4-nitrophenyl phosphatase